MGSERADKPATTKTAAPGRGGCPTVGPLRAGGPTPRQARDAHQPPKSHTRTFSWRETTTPSRRSAPSGTSILCRLLRPRSMLARRRSASPASLLSDGWAPPPQVGGGASGPPGVPPSAAGTGTAPGGGDSIPAQGDRAVSSRRQLYTLHHSGGISEPALLDQCQSDSTACAPADSVGIGRPSEEARWAPPPQNRWMGVRRGNRGEGTTACGPFPQSSVTGVCAGTVMRQPRFHLRCRKLRVVMLSRNLRVLQHRAGVEGHSGHQLAGLLRSSSAAYWALPAQWSTSRARSTGSGWLSGRVCAFLRYLHWCAYCNGRADQAGSPGAHTLTTPSSHDRGQSTGQLASPSNACGRTSPGGLLMPRHNCELDGETLPG
jgi:hypothetical protein